MSHWFKTIDYRAKVAFSLDFPFKDNRAWGIKYRAHHGVHLL